MDVVSSRNGHLRQAEFSSLGLSGWYLLLSFPEHQTQYVKGYTFSPFHVLLTEFIGPEKSEAVQK